MGGICSAHFGRTEPDCPACNADIRDLIPNFDQLVAESEAAGRHTCECGFVYFKVVDSCPLCYRKRQE